MSSNQAEDEDDADTGSERSISGESNMEASLMRMIDGLGDDDAVEHKREIENKKAAADSKRADADVRRAQSESEQVRLAERRQTLDEARHLEEVQDRKADRAEREEIRQDRVAERKEALDRQQARKSLRDTQLAMMQVIAALLNK